MKIIVLFLTVVGMTFAQTISGASSPSAGQTATASFIPVPMPQWLITINCNQTTFVPGTATKGTKWTCTLQSNLTAPTGGSFAFTFDPSPTWLIVPSPLTIPAGASSATFALSGL